MTQKTPSNNINLSFIFNHYNRSRCFAPIRKQYQINYNTIVVLLGIYLYNIYESSDVSRTALMNYISYFDYKHFTYSFNKLVEVNMITQAGKGKYRISDLGIDTVQQISDNTEQLIYSFCSKYDIVL